RLVVAGCDAVGGQDLVGQGHQRETQLVDLVAGRKLLSGARERRPAQIGETLGERGRYAQRGAVGVRVRTQRLLPRLLDANGSQVELAIHLESLVVVGEAEVGHAAA